MKEGAAVVKEIRLALSKQPTKPHPTLDSGGIYVETAYQSVVELAVGNSGTAFEIPAMQVTQTTGEVVPEFRWLYPNLPRIDFRDGLLDHERGGDHL